MQYVFFLGNLLKYIFYSYSLIKLFPTVLLLCSNHTTLALAIKYYEFSVSKIHKHENIQNREVNPKPLENIFLICSFKHLVKIHSYLSLLMFNLALCLLISFVFYVKSFEDQVCFWSLWLDYPESVIKTNTRLKKFLLIYLWLHIHIYWHITIFVRTMDFYP